MYNPSPQAEALILGVVFRARKTAAGRYARVNNIQRVHELWSLGYPAITALVRQVEWEWLDLEHPTLQAFKTYQAEITALRSLLPAQTALVQPPDRGLRHLCGKQLVVYGPERASELTLYQLWKFLFVTAIVEATHTSLKVVYGEGIEETFALTSARIMLDTDVQLLRSASDDQIAAMIQAADHEVDDPGILHVFAAQLLGHAL